MAAQIRAWAGPRMRSPRRAAALPEPSLLRAPVDLFKEGSHDAKKSDEQAAQSEKQGGCLPQSAVGGQSGLKATGGRRHNKADDREEEQHAGKNVEISRHGPV